MPLVLHVATNGNDAWTGRPSAPTADGRDGPFATLGRARDAARGLKGAGGATVRVRGGVHRLAEPFVLGPEDSGASQAPVVYEAFPGEQPALSGGRAITGFRTSSPVWEAVIPEVKEGRWNFRQLFVNGQRRPRARSPNEGWFRIAGYFPGPAGGPGVKPHARDRFRFAPGDLQPWEPLTDVNLVLLHSWETSIHPLASVDPDLHVATLAAPMKEWWGLGYWEDGQRYYVEGAREFLDRPGEWHLDRAAGVLRYRPLPGEKPEATDVVAPALSELVRIDGDPDRGQFVAHVTLRGLALQHADWVLDPKGNSSTQAAVEVPAAVTVDGALNCTVESCEIAHVGTYGLWFRRGCKDGLIRRNRLHDLGAGGIRVGEDRMAANDAAESCRIRVDNNHIFDGGHVYAGAVGIWVAQSSHNTISHNDIHDLRYSGISIGWNWGLEENRTHHNVVEWNHVHDLVRDVLSDAGLIYCLGVSPGSVIRNNVFHDIHPYETPGYGWGIYLDGKCGGYLVESNLVYATRNGGLMFSNGGHAHVIRNNVFALSQFEALWPYAEKRPSTFRHNVVYLTQGALLKRGPGEASLRERLDAGESPGDWDQNLYWHTAGAGALRFYKRTFEQWRAIGLDLHSAVADPEFVDVGRGDFRLKDASPARRLGIQSLDLRLAGLYGDPAWFAEARHESCAMRPLPPPPAPPAPLEIDDGFEGTAVGAPPARARVDGTHAGASVLVDDSRAAVGARSLRIADSQATKPDWQPHFYYEPHHTGGVVRQSFDLWLSPDAVVMTEWRDDLEEYPRCIGPSIRFDGQGSVAAGGRVLATMPTASWYRVEIEAALGADAAPSYTLALTRTGSAPQTFRDVPFSGADFRSLHWLGFASLAATDTVWHIDNLRVGRRP
jgi:hypothetical protein